jgi:hypothetical protein
VQYVSKQEKIVYGPLLNLLLVNGKDWEKENPVRALTKEALSLF